MYFRIRSNHQLFRSINSEYPYMIIQYDMIIYIFQLYPKYINYLSFQVFFLNHNHRNSLYNFYTCIYNSKQMKDNYKYNICISFHHRILAYILDNLYKMYYMYIVFLLFHSRTKCIVYFLGKFNKCTDRYQHLMQS